MQQKNEVVPMDTKRSVSQESDTPRPLQANLLDQLDRNERAKQFLLRKQRAAIRKFKKDFPTMSQQLLNEQIMCIFRLYKLNTKRVYSGSNQSMLLAGTLFILICSLFMYSGTGMNFSNNIQDDSMSN